MTTWPTIMSDASAGDVLTAANLNTLVDALQHLESAWTLETGLLTAVTTAPSTLGTDATYYKQIGKMLIVRYYFEWSGSTNNGSGIYRLTLPNSLSTASTGTQAISVRRKLVGALGGAGGFAAASTTFFDLDPLASGSGWISGDYIAGTAMVEVA